MRQSVNLAKKSASRSCVVLASAASCETCKRMKSLEVDHILPRRHGGSDDLSNLQALCYKCNANKGARER